MNLVSVHGLVLVLVLAGISGCASSKENTKLNEKVSEENSVKSSDDFQKEANSIIEKAPGLTPEQRAKLLAIRQEMTSKRIALKEESRQLRTVLIKDIVSKENTETEMSLIKERLRKIEDERLTILFAAIQKANEALGNAAFEHQKELEATLRDDRGGRSE
jgi:nitrogen regulatory protein PII-like uncharacterized protein